MPTYVTLFKWTEQGVKDIRNVPARFDAARKLVEAGGGRTLGIYVTMGDWNIVDSLLKRHFDDPDKGSQQM